MGTTVYGYKMAKIAEKAARRKMSGAEYIDYLEMKQKNRKNRTKEK